jgi:hypothetical protein
MIKSIVTVSSMIDYYNIPITLARVLYLVGYRLPYILYAMTTDHLWTRIFLQYCKYLIPRSICEPEGVVLRNILVKSIYRGYELQKTQPLTPTMTAKTKFISVGHGLWWCGTVLACLASNVHFIFWKRKLGAFTTRGCCQCMLGSHSFNGGWRHKETSYVVPDWRNLPCWMSRSTINRTKKR